MRTVFIRHGLTAGNLKKRYIGSTDEPLCGEGIARLKMQEYPRCEVLVCSPMKRCLQTAELIFPGQEIVTDSALRECDFGDFEGRNYAELSGNADYQGWIDSGGALPFPNGEVPQDFRERCTSAFGRLVSRFGSSQSLAFVVHGGTIMSIFEKYAVPRRDYFGWYCENGCGYICEWDGTELHITEKL